MHLYRLFTATRVYACLLLTLLCSFHVRAQDFLYRRYTIEDGLLSSDNYQVIQDKTGYIWICSKNGLVRYNGYDFKTFTTADGLPINDIWELRCDSKNRIWLHSFSKGACYIQHNTVHIVKGSADIDNLFFANEYKDTVIFLSKQYQYKPFEHYYLAPDGSFGRYHYKKNALGWEVSGDYRKEGWLIYEKRSENLSGRYFSLTHLKTNKSWKCPVMASLGKTEILPMGTFFTFKNRQQPDSILILDKDKPLFVNIHHYFGGHVSQMRYISSPYCYVVTVNGKNRFYTNILTKERNYNYENRLNEVERQFGKDWFLFIDRDRNMWITLMRGEILFIPAFTEKVESYSLQNEAGYLTGIQQLFMSGKHLFALTSDKQVYYSPCPEIRFRKMPHTDNVNVQCILNPFDNRYMYVLGNQRIAEFDPANPTRPPVSMLNMINTIFFKSFTFLSNDEIICSNGFLKTIRNGKLIQGNLLFRFKGKTEEVIVFGDKLIVRSPMTLHIIDRKSGKLLREITGIEVNASCMTSHGLLLGTNGSGLVMLTPDLRIIPQGLKSKSIYSLSTYRQWLLVATNQGLYVLNATTKKIVNVWNRYSGLSATEVNGVCADQRYIYIATKRGLNRISGDLIATPFKSHVQLLPGPVFINGVPSRMDHPLHYNQRNIRLTFEAISFTTMSFDSYRYKLIEYDESWKFSNQKTIVYNNLQPGHYKLVVEALNKEGEVISNRLVTYFTIQPHFTQTALAKTIFIFLIIGVVGILIWVTAHMLNIRARRKEHLLKLELRALRAQLNPHFVFNSLNSLQNILLLKGEEEANRHIQAFAGLMRKVLDNSKNETISLAEEMTFLRNYITLEENRLTEKMELDLRYTGSVSPDDIRFPVMIFQPIVENAVIHGLASKSGYKLLKVHFELEDRTLITTIEDNGIGRTNAALLKSGRTHKSWASTILREKINVMNKIRNDSIRYEMTDLTDENGESAGTRVVLYLKVDLAQPMK